MRLTVLGGAAACPNPGQGSAGYLVEHDGTRLLLDCGPDTLSVLRAHTDFRQIDAVLISHVHSDHTLDLVAYRYGLKYAPGADGRAVPLWMPPGGTDFLNRVAVAFAAGDERANAFFSEVFAFEEYDPAATYMIGPFTIRFHPSRHYIPCWAMRIEAGGRSLAYLADTGPMSELAEFACDVDLAICEGTLPEGAEEQPGGSSGHLTAGQAGALAAAAGARRLLLTHLWAEIGNAAYQAAAEATFGAPISVATPGLVIDI